jgi:hypothetical protein
LTCVANLASIFSTSNRTEFCLGGDLWLSQ